MRTQTAQKIIKQTKEDYENLAEKFSDTRANLWSELEELAKHVKDGDKILDLGCGNGRLYELFSAGGGSAFGGKDRKVEYVGVDSCARLIEIANNKLKISASAKATTDRQNSRPKGARLAQQNWAAKFKTTTQNSKVQFIVGDALNLPFEDNEFNVIFAIALLHHIPSEELRLKILENCYRILKPGGFLILTVWNLWQPKLLLKYKIWPMLLGWRLPMLDWKDVFIPWHITRTDTDKKHGPRKVAPLLRGKQARTIQRYYHAFCPAELKNLIKNSKFNIIDSYYSLKGKRANVLNGFNLILIAKKSEK